MAHLIDTMAYCCQTPWYGLGTLLPPNQSLDLWLDAAGMNWSIEHSDVLFQSGDSASTDMPLPFNTCYLSSRKSPS